jgi:hypothetical protein
VRCQERDLDAGQVLAFAQSRKHSRGLDLSFAVEVIAGLGLDGGGASFEPCPQPPSGRLLQLIDGLGAGGQDRRADSAAV